VKFEKRNFGSEHNLCVFTNGSKKCGGGGGEKEGLEDPRHWQGRLQLLFVAKNKDAATVYCAEDLTCHCRT